jgi:uncharacterized protein (DUF1330 family)
MRFERLVGLFINDDDMYTKYRENMTPILKTYGGGFAYDFKIQETLQNESEKPINRVFLIYFRDENAMIEFFSNEEYLKIKEEFFDLSVGSAHEISKYLN